MGKALPPPLHPCSLPKDKRGLLALFARQSRKGRFQHLPDICRGRPSPGQGRRLRRLDRAGGLYGGANSSAIRQFLFDKCEFNWLFGLINTSRGWFKDVDIDRFAAFSAKANSYTRTVMTKFGLRGPEDLGREAVPIDADIIRNQAPDTYAIPDLRSSSELRTSLKMYAAHPAFGDLSAGPPTRRYQRELDMGTDRRLFTTAPEGLPVYEGRMIDQYDYRAKTYESGHGNSARWTDQPFGSEGKTIAPQWRVLRKDVPEKLGDRCDRFRIGFGDVANPRNVRSLVATSHPARDNLRAYCSHHCLRRGP